ncbi:MAG TPA: CPBP family intramembrane glutamic endopeptidase [Terriglobales bacterium]|nr:CPBP family intramembrane glutamic endopeptidase [Terriglobales bacterium]
MDLILGEDGRLRSGWRFLLSVVVFFFVNGFAIDVANTLAGPSDRKFELFYRPFLAIFLLASFSVLLKLLDRVEGNPLPAMGLRRCHFAKDVAVGICLGVVMVGLAVLLLALVCHIEFQVVLSGHSAKLALAVLLILATGAMAEELAFRGYPFQRLVEGTGTIVALILTSVLFGIVHLRNPHASVVGVINTIAIGIVFALAYLRTRSLWLPWALHFGWNLSLGLLFGLPVSGLREFGVVVRGTATGPAWITGGAYGIEGGAAGTLGIAAGLAFVLLMIKRRLEPPIRFCQELTPDERVSLSIQVSEGSGPPAAR